MSDLAIIAAQIFDPVRLGIGGIAGLLLCLALAYADERARIFLLVVGIIIGGAISAYIVALIIPPVHFGVFLTGWIISSLEVWGATAIVRTLAAKLR